MIKKSSKPAKVSAEDLSRAFGSSSGDIDSTDQAVAERSGSDDKVAAVKAENAPPRVPTFTPEAREWIQNDKILNTEGLFGQRGLLPLSPEAFQRRAQFLGRPLTVADLEEISPAAADESAPATATCTPCGGQIISFVKVALIADNGDLKRNKNGNITYRGQAVTTGRPLTVHAAHTGDCLYALRDNLKQKKELRNGRKVADLLPSQTFEQAKERLAGLQGYFDKIAAKKQAENQAFKQRLGGGGNVGEIARYHNPAPTTLRGKRRNRPRWANDADSK